MIISSFGITVLGDTISSNNSNSTNNASRYSMKSRSSDALEIISISDEPINEDNDTAYEYIHIKLKLKINVSDTYSIFISMAPSNIKANDYKINSYSVDDHEAILKFSGDVIYSSSRNGPYTISISIYNSIPEIMVEREYYTDYYSYEDFNPTPVEEPIGLGSITVVSNTIKLVTNTFVAIIYEDTPMINFYYNSDDGETARFTVKYNSILCFNDNSPVDGKFQSNELKYWGDLQNSRWNSPKILMEDFNNFDFQIQTIVELMDEFDTPIKTKLELTFHYSSLTRSDDVEYSRKFDISMKVLGPPLSGITHISLLHTLEDDFGNHNFFEPSQGDKISFMTNENKEHGYYSWKNFIEVTTKSGETSSKSVTYNTKQNLEPNIMYLYLNYVYSTDTSEIFHDPVVGVNPNNQPIPPGEISPEIITHNKWLILYFVVAVIASVVMVGNYYRQKKKRDRY
jgi:hypothetical protein